MAINETRCRACDGDGILADDEGWKYECSVCHGTGIEQPEVKVKSVDDNNRLLD